MNLMCNKLSISRFELITAEVYDTSVDDLEYDRSKAEAALAAPFGGPGEFVLYSDPVEMGSRCCVELIVRRPLPHDNKRVAYLCLQEMLARYPWAQFDAKPQKIAEMLDGLGSGSKGEAEFILWVRSEIGRAAVRRYDLRFGVKP
jgi:hypothetical protein